MKIHPYGKPIRTPWWKAFLIVVALSGLSFLWAVLLIEWAAGCGGSYIDADGVRHQHECVFIPNSERK